MTLEEIVKILEAWEDDGKGYIVPFSYQGIAHELLAQLAHKSRPDRELLKIDVAIRLADFKGLDWNWASTQQSCFIEAHKIIALFPDEEEIRKQLKEAQKKLNEWQVQV